MKDKNAENCCVDVIIRHDDFEIFKSIYKNVEIVKKDVVKHTIWDTVRVCVESEEKLCSNI